MSHYYIVVICISPLRIQPHWKAEHYICHSSIRHLLVLCHTHRLLFIPADNNLLIKYVLFNGTDVNWWATPNTYNSQWLSIGLHMTLSEFNPTVAYDFVVTVRGYVPTLCPAVTFMQVRGETHRSP